MDVAPGFQGGRPLVSYEGFSHETARWVPADLGKCRDVVRTGLRYGWTSIRRAHGVVRAEVNSAGSCERPVVRHLRGVPLPLPGSRFPAGVRAYLVTQVWRCRQCEQCRWMRSMHWAHRAKTEFDRAARTWLGTITLSPFQHSLIDAKVAAKAHETGASWLTDWTSRDVFRERCEIMGREISLWLDRIRVTERRRRGRGGVPPRFSYLLVAEEHRSERTSTTMVGRPHYHILVHEALPYELIRPEEEHLTAKGKVRVADGAMVRTQWQLGYTQFELCTDSRAASYLCKYLSKDMLWRVRASRAYGEETQASEASPGTSDETSDSYLYTGGGVSSPPSGAAVVPAAVGTGPGRAGDGPRDPSRTDDGPRDPSIGTTKERHPPTMRETLPSPHLR